MVKMKSMQKTCLKQKNESTSVRRSGRLKKNVPNDNILYDTDTDSETEGSTNSEDGVKPGARSKRVRAKTKDLRAKCVFCGLVTLSETSLRHVRRKHLNKITNIKDEDDQLKIRCMLCKEIVSTDSFQSHVIHFHPASVEKNTNHSHFRKIEVGCLYCDITLGNQWYMDHLKDEHPDEAEKMRKTGAKGQDKEKSVVDAVQTMNYEHRVNCAYCADPKKMTLIECNAHMQECHPNYENTNSKSDKETKEQAKQRKYLLIDRSKYLPAKPSPPKVYNCKSCEEKCDSMKSLYNHNKQMHGVTLCCNFCYQFFKHKEQRENHEDEEHAIMKYKCETCSKEFARASSLKSHKKYVHLGIVAQSELLQKRTRKDENALCNHCGKTFKRFTYLKWHVFRRHSDRNFQCDTCGKTFGSEPILKVHTKIHKKTRRGLTKYHEPLDNRHSEACKTEINDYGETVDEKHPPTEMGTCIKTEPNVYRCSVKMEEPEVVKDKIFACEYFGCDKRYHDRRHLRQHEQIKHGRPKYSPTTEKGYKDKIFACEYSGCDKRYHDRRHLRQHERIKHGRPKIIVIPSPATMKRYKGKIFACKVVGCDKQYTCTTNLRTHLKSHQHKSDQQTKKTKEKSGSFLPISKDSFEPLDEVVTIKNPEKTSVSQRGH